MTFKLKTIDLPVDPIILLVVFRRLTAGPVRSTCERRPPVFMYFFPIVGSFLSSSLMMSLS